jgi:hypothetical protein
MSPGGVNGPGKVEAAIFIPPFALRLARAGVATALAAGPAELRAAMTPGPAILVHVYREVAYRIDTPEVLEAEGRAAGVFNAARSGPIVADKVLTNEFLTGRGVRMPSLSPEGRVFSNLRQDSAGGVVIVDRLDRAEAGRYNTSFVDTRITLAGQTYYTSVRLLCVGARILHGYVRARDVAEGSASVHALDTPLDPRLVEMLQECQVEQRMPELVDLAAGIAAALGPGFYAHDVLMPNDGGTAPALRDRLQVQRPVLPRTPVAGGRGITLPPDHVHHARVGRDERRPLSRRMRATRLSAIAPSLVDDRPALRYHVADRPTETRVAQVPDHP